MYSQEPFGAEPLAGDASGVASAYFTLSPSASHTVGLKSVTAFGVGTSWGASNPFSIVSGPGTGLTNYVRISNTSATFDFTQTAVGSTPIVIADSNSGTTQNFVVAAVVPGAPTGVALTNNDDGTVTATYTQPADNGGAPITGNSLLASTGQTASASTPGAAITFMATSGVALTAQVRATNSAGDGPYSSASPSITPTNSTERQVLLRAPYLSTDALGTKTVQLFHIVGGALVAATAAITTGFTAIPNIANGWWVLVNVPTNDANGGFSGIAVFSNINGSGKAAIEVYIPPLTEPTQFVAHKIAPFLVTDVITSPGYQLYALNGTAFGSRVTAGILGISGVTNGYVARLSLAPNTGSGGVHYGIVWDGG